MGMNVPRMSVMLLSVGEGKIDQEYKVNDDSFVHIFGTNWWAQSFTVAATHTLRRCILKFDKAGSPGILTVSIRATTAGKPSGSDLAVATKDLDAFTFQSGGNWIYLDMVTPVVVTAAAVMAIVCRTAGADTSNDGLWQADITSPAYSGGSIISSSDSGSTWNAPDTTVDAMFKEGA